MPKKNPTRKPLTQEARRVARRAKRLWIEKKKAEQLTIDDAAHAMGFSGSAFSQYVNGTIPMNTDAVKRFADYLGVKPTDLDPDWLGGLDVLSVNETPAPFNGEPPDSTAASPTPRDVVLTAVRHLPEREFIQVLQSVKLSREGTALLAKALIDRLSVGPDT